jgi:hypothetical protein
VRSGFLALVVLLGLLAAGAAAGASFTFALSSATTVTAPGVTLNGVDQTSTFAMQYTVTYNGTAGWNVQASSTTLTSGSDTLAAMKVTAVTNVPCTTKNCIDPTSNVGLPVTLTTTPQRIFNATGSSGQCTCVLNATYLVTYPANALPGTYTATVTVNGSTGP